MTNLEERPPVAAGSDPDPDLVPGFRRPTPASDGSAARAAGRSSAASPPRAPARWPRQRAWCTSRASTVRHGAAEARGSKHGQPEAQGRLRSSPRSARRPPTRSRCRPASGPTSLISWGDTFLGASETLEFGFNNDFLAYFPLTGLRRGHPLRQPRVPRPVLPARVQGARPAAGQDAGAGPDRAGRRRQLASCTSSATTTASGRSSTARRYNRRIYGDRPVFDFTGPRAGDTGTPNIGDDRQRLRRQLLRRHHALGHGALLRGELRRLRARPTTARTPRVRLAAVRRQHELARRGVRLHGLREVRLGLRARPVRPGDTPTKHTALGRFRHENTAFRHVPRKPFVLYMGDDKANEGLYKFVSDRPYKPGQKIAQPQHPRERHALHRPLRARGPPPLRERRRRHADQPDRGHRHVGRGARLGAPRHRHAAARPHRRRVRRCTSPSTGREDVEVAEDGASTWP